MISDARRLLQEVKSGRSKDDRETQRGKAVNLTLFPVMNSLRSMPSSIYGTPFMDPIEQLAEAALQRDSLRLRSLVQDMTRSNINWSSLPRPQTKDVRLLAIAAALAELLAARQNQTPPVWTKEIGALKEPFFLLRSAETMKRLRRLCETQSPEPMRKRQLYAPPNFLEFA